jgi:hypothetical protein
MAKVSTLMQRVCTTLNTSETTSLNKMRDKSTIEIELTLSKIDGSDFSEEEKNWICNQMLVRHTHIMEICMRFEGKFGTTIQGGGCVGYAVKRKKDGFMG